MNEIKSIAPVNIFDMVDEREVKERALFNKTCELMKKMTGEGSSKESILDTLKGIDLPLSIHLAVTSKFSEICKYGRPLTKRERKAGLR